MKGNIKIKEEAKYHYAKDNPNVYIENPSRGYVFKRYDYRNGDTRWYITNPDVDRKDLDTKLTEEDFRTYYNSKTKSQCKY